MNNESAILTTMVRLSKSHILVLWMIFLKLGFGQSPGTIAGTVFDAKGDPAPLARIAVMEDKSENRKYLIADENGSFRAPGLAPGSYRLIVESVLAGSSTIAVTLHAGETLNVRAALTVTREPLSFPRDRSEITPGQPGGDIEGYGPYGSRGNISFNSIGQRSQNNNYRFDGMDNNENWVRGTILQPPTEAIRPVSFSRGYIPAEFGHATGATVSVASRSGSEEFHGSVFDGLGTSALNTRNFFDGSRKSGMAINRFGAGLGGPVTRHGWFFFADFEVLRGRHDLTVVSTVPTVSQKAGGFASFPIYNPLSIHDIGGNLYSREPFPENQIPLRLMPTPSRNLIALYPDPNLPGAANNYRFNAPYVQNQDRFDVRSDRKFSDRNSLFVRLTHEGSEARSPSAFPGGFGTDVAQHADGETTNTNAWGGILSHTFAIRPSLINKFRAGAAGINLHARANDQGVSASTLLGMPGLGADGIPSIIPTGFTALGAAGPAPLQVRSVNYQIEDSANWTSARHSWEFGIQVIRRHADGNASRWTDRGSFFFTPDYTSQPGASLATGDSIASLLMGYPSEVRRDVQFSPYQLRGWELSGFAQDQIRISHRLTIQAGFRYSYIPPITEVKNRMVNFNFTLNTPALDQFAARGGVNQYAGLGFNKRALAPRIGFAFDLARDGSTVLRGGFSTAYDSGTYSTMGALAQNAPYASRLDMINGTFQLGPNLTAGLPAPVAVSLLDPTALNSAHGAIYAIQPQQFTPYADQWDMFVQHRLRPGLILEVGLESSMGIHLYAAYDANQPYPAPTPYATARYPFEPYESRIDYLAMGGGSTYYGGVARLTGRLAPGLNVVLSYSRAKSIDDAVAPGTDPQSRPAAPQYIYSHRGNRSPSPFDIAQRAVLIVHYDVPKLQSRFLANWRVGTIITLQTGFPFTPELATNSLNNGGFQLPNRVGEGSLQSDQRSYLNWFNTNLGPSAAGAAFLIPPLYQYGNSGFDILRGPGLANVDAMLIRIFGVGDRLHVQPEIGVSNLLNHTNLALPQRILGVESSGVISHTITSARQFRLAMTLTW